MKITHRRHKAAFTLIEMMAVVSIIVILASLIVGSYGYIMNRQSTAKARVQIELLSKALEDYKSDFGAYPATDDKPTASGTAGTSTSSILFKALFKEGYDFSVASAATQTTWTKATKIYLPDLDPVTSKQGWTSTPASDTTIIVDPWGNQYCYRTAYNSGTPPVANASTLNPDFDLWSMGKDGKTNPGTPSDKVNLDDIKN